MVGLAAAALATTALAQPVERNLPPAPQAPPTAIQEPAAPGSINDDRSLGANLSSIVALGPTSQVEANAPPGVDATRVKRLAGEEARGVLGRFLGRPLTRKLIGQIETAIVREYRRQGYPFVEVSTPEQEITAGVLQIRVIEFRVGKLAISHVGARQAAAIERQIRAQPGDEIDASLMLQDLDWLNRYPGRVLTPTFTPGAALGQTDVDLVVTPTKPWSVSAGFANSGSPATELDRYYVGASLGAHVLTDEFLSVQVTGSPEFWWTDGQPFDDDHAAYESAASRLVVATAPRQDLEVTLNAVETNEPEQAFVVRQETLEANLGYRSAVSNVVPLPGDATFGVEASRQNRLTFFGDTQVAGSSVDVFQLFGEWSNSWSDAWGAGAADVSVHGSPGGIDDRNTAAAFASNTSGRVDSAVYVYATVDLSHQTELPFGFVLSTAVNGQYAGRPLPDSQQIALGGQSAVRGYTIDDGALDDGAVARDELRASPLPILKRGPLAPWSLAPFAFADAGFGRDEAAGQDAWIASAGLGPDLRLGSTASAGADVAWPLRSAAVTREGAPMLDVRATLAF